jgi:hypothetical protein
MNLIPGFFEQSKKIIFRAYGASMVPVLFPGNKICISKKRIDSLKENDIVALKKNNSLIVHRLIYIHRKNHKIDWAVTKGDNNQKSDGIVYPSQILGSLDYRLIKQKKSYPDNIYLIQSTIYFTEIEKLNDELLSQKVPYTILKGLPVHLLYEKKIPKKLYADCDILISPDHYTSCIKVFNKLGFKPVDNSYLQLHKNASFLKKEISYYKIVNNFPVVFDIHLEPVFGLTQISSTQFFYSSQLIKSLGFAMQSEVRNVKIKGVVLPVLPEKYLVPYLLLHFFHHNFQGVHRLKLISIILLSIENKGNKEEILSSILAVIFKYKLNNYVWPGLYLVDRYFQSKNTSYLLKKICVSKFIQNYSLILMKRAPLFDDPVSRTIDGVTRFLNVFIFSSRNIFIRLCIFINIQTWLMIAQAVINLGKIGYANASRIFNTNKLIKMTSS